MAWPAPQRAWSFGYSYSPQGRTTAIATNSLEQTVTTLGYDAAGRLLSANHGLPTLWQYDGNDNLLGWTSTGLNGLPTPPQATYAYTDAALGAITPTGWLPNELVGVTTTLANLSVVTATYGYDGVGNPIAISGTNGFSQTLSYNAQGLLSAATRQDDSTPQRAVAITYDALGRRRSYTVSLSGQGQPLIQETLRYRGQSRAVSQVVVSGTNTTPFTETFVYRPSGAPLELVYQKQGASAQRYWYVVDGQGNVAGLVDNTGTRVNGYTYDVWGQPSVILEGLPQPLRYRGYWYDGWDNSLGTSKDQNWSQGTLPWYALGAREYDPALERFLQPDPSALDGVRSYVYCRDDPASCADPSGLEGNSNDPEVGAQIEAVLRTAVGEGVSLPASEPGLGATAAADASAPTSADLVASAPSQDTAFAGAETTAAGGPEQQPLPGLEPGSIPPDPYEFRGTLQTGDTESRGIYRLLNKAAPTDVIGFDYVDLARSVADQIRDKLGGLKAKLTVAVGSINGDLYLAVDSRVSDTVIGYLERAYNFSFR